MRNTQTGPGLIGVGLAILFAAAWWPAAPVLTAMAIIALGATDVTVSRLRGTTAALSITILHITTYALLYTLFVGARLHEFTGSLATEADGFATLDLVASVLPMAIALKRISSFLRQSIMSRP